MRVPVTLIDIDNAGFYTESLGGSRYVIVFVRGQRLPPPETLRDSEQDCARPTIVKYFLVDMRVLREFRTYNSLGSTNRSFMEYCDDFGVRRKLTAPCKPQQKGSVESALASTIEAG